jgi:hypothetical protein
MRLRYHLASLAFVPVFAVVPLLPETSVRCGGGGNNTKPTCPEGEVPHHRRICAEDRYTHVWRCIDQNWCS